VTFCCRTYVMSPASSSCLSSTGTPAHRACETILIAFHLAGFVVSELPQLQSNCLQNLGPDAATSLPDESAERGRFEAVSDWPVEQNGTRRYWRRYWPVAQSSPCMCSDQRRTLWLLNLFHFFFEIFSITFIVNQHRSDFRNLLTVMFTRCGGMFNDQFYKFIAESNSERRV